MARVMIADDAAFVRHVVREMLEQAGHEVVAEATTGEEAIAAFADAHPDVAVIDINMPVMDGIRAGEAIRQTAPEAGLVVASVYASDHHRRDAAEIDAVFLEKPYTLAALQVAIALAESA